MIKVNETVEFHDEYNEKKSGIVEKLSGLKANIRVGRKLYRGVINSKSNTTRPRFTSIVKKTKSIPKTETKPTETTKPTVIETPTIDEKSDK